jgi:hypothetical protein
VRFELTPIAEGRPAAVAEALQRVLAHAALGLAREALPLELVDQLLHADREHALGRVRVAAANRIGDRHADLAQLALIEASQKPFS